MADKALSGLFPESLQTTLVLIGAVQLQQGHSDQLC